MAKKKPREKFKLRILIRKYLRSLPQGVLLNTHKDLHLVRKFIRRETGNRVSEKKIFAEIIAMIGRNVICYPASSDLENYQMGVIAKSRIPRLPKNANRGQRIAHLLYWGRRAA